MVNTPFGEQIPNSLRIYERAGRVIPGGIYGHTSPAAGIPGIFPYFAERAKGARYWDVDGREMLDFMCGYGTNLLGYGDPEIESAAADQRARGNVFNHPTETTVTLAETLVERIDFADWVVFGKNGSDMTTWAIQVAREYTGKPKIFKVEGAYHGVAPWATPGKGGLLPEDRKHIHNFTWNDMDSFQRLLGRFKNEVAGVIITPFHHPGFCPSEMPRPGFLENLESACRAEGILLILDDIRAGFRLHEGGSHRKFGITPDLACYCKALANGYPVSATAGTEALKVAASRVFLTGSYWNNAVAMAAALACVEAISERRVPERLERLGTRLARGLEKAGAEKGHHVRVAGPPSMPSLYFEGDRDLKMIRDFCALAVSRGIFFHPYHNWFLCHAHTEADIDRALQVSETIFSELPLYSDVS